MALCDESPLQTDAIVGKTCEEHLYSEYTTKQREEHRKNGLTLVSSKNCQRTNRHERLPCKEISEFFAEYRLYVKPV